MTISDKFGLKVTLWAWCCLVMSWGDSLARMERTKFLSGFRIDPNGGWQWALALHASAEKPAGFWQLPQRRCGEERGSLWWRGGCTTTPAGPLCTHKHVEPMPAFLILFPFLAVHTFWFTLYGRSNQRMKKKPCSQHTLLMLCLVTNPGPIPPCLKNGKSGTRQNTKGHCRERPVLCYPPNLTQWVVHITRPTQSEFFPLGFRVGRYDRKNLFALEDNWFSTGGASWAGRIWIFHHNCTKKWKKRHWLREGKYIS